MYGTTRGHYLLSRATLLRPEQPASMRTPDPGRVRQFLAIWRAAMLDLWRRTAAHMRVLTLA